MPGYEYKGDPKRIAEIFEPIVRKRGKKLCTYPCEVEKTCEAVIYGKEMMAEDDLIFALWTENKSMVYSKLQIRTALEIILEAKKKEWHMSSDAQEDWKVTICRRIRNMCRCISQKMSSKRSSGDPQWLRELRLGKVRSRAGDVESPNEEETQQPEPEEDEEPDDGSLNRVESKATSSTQRYLTIKFDRELMLATREGTGRHASVETSEPIKDRVAPGHEMVEAEFRDGSKHRVPGLTWETFRALIRAGKAKGMGVLLSLEHKTTKHAIHIMQRVDRKLLLSIYEQGRQKLQVSLDMFGKVEDQGVQLDYGSEVLKKAMDFLTPIATRFANDELSGDQLIGERDRLMKEQNITATPKNWKKRPAAAETSPPRVLKRPAAEKKSKIVAPVTPITSPIASDISESSLEPERQIVVRAEPEENAEPQERAAPIYRAYEEMDLMPLGLLELAYDV
jgi:hypothetical protein